MFFMEVASNRKNPAAHLQHPTLCEIASWMFPKQHAGRSDEQEETEEIKNEMKTVHQCDTAQDHGAAHDECPYYSPDQDASLRHRRNAKMRENQHKYENVVHAQRILDEIAGEKIERVVRSFDSPDQGVKGKRH